MSDMKKIPFVSSEIAGLWNAYMSESLVVRVLSYFINKVDDDEIRTILQHTNDLSNQNIIEITDLFNREGLPIPDGFTDNDVNINAPRLFTDTFYLVYLAFMARIGMHNYTLTLNQIAHSDIRDYFSKRIVDSIDLYNKTTDLRLSKGIFIRAPYVEVPKKVLYIKNQTFMLDVFGKKRPLILNEVTQLFGTTFSNIVGKAIATGFGQVSSNEKISAYFFEGMDLASDIIKELTIVFSDEEVPIPSTSDSYITDSLVAPFSEKLMLTHMLMISSSAVSSLGMAVSTILRSDLNIMYFKYITDVIKFSQKGAKILVDNEWLEQPPSVIKHKDLVEK